VADVVYEARRSTSQSRYEPVSLARRLAGNEDYEQIVRFRATRFHYEPISRAQAQKIANDSSGCTPRACASGPVWQGRCARIEVRPP
jgi:hypothetical protein